MHRKKFGMHVTLHLFFKILRFGQNRYGIDKPCLKSKHYVNTVTICLYSNLSFNLCFDASVLEKVFLSLIHIIFLTKFLNLWILNSTFLTADFKTVTKCQYRNVTVLTVMVLMYFQYFLPKIMITPSNRAIKVIFC